MSTGATQAERRAEARIGQVLRGKWQLDRVLGIGGLAAVYAATHRAGKRVAIKILHPELSMYDEIRSRFIREAHVANRVGHPGVVSVADDDVTESGEAFLVMDLLDGETLDARRKKAGGTLEVPFVLSMAAQVLDVLVAAHDKTIIHRDLKPENLFLTSDDRVMVLDFGIARLRDVSSGDHATQTGMTMGTPAYMPPEQARGRWELVDARSDLWALGATMFTLLAGRTVHGALTMNEALAAVITRPAPPLRSIAAGVPEVVASVVDRALAFEPKDRWLDARSMQQAVRDAVAALGEDAAATVPLVPAPRVENEPARGAPRAAREKASAQAVVEQPAEGSTGVPVASTGIGARREIRWIALAGMAAIAVVLGLTAVLVVKAKRADVPAATSSVPAVSASTDGPVAAETASALPAASPSVNPALTEEAGALPVVAEIKATATPGTAAPRPPAASSARVATMLPDKPAPTVATAMAASSDPFAKRTRPKK